MRTYNCSFCELRDPGLFGIVILRVDGSPDELPIAVSVILQSNVVLGLHAVAPLPSEISRVEAVPEIGVQYSSL